MDSVIDVYFEQEIEILVASDELDEQAVWDVLETHSVEISKITRS